MAGSVPRPPAEEVSEAGSEDDLLVERFTRGDRSAFDQIVTNHYARVAGLARRLLGWDDDVADVVQEVFLSALQNLPTFRRRASLSTWLTTITVNACRRHRRRWFLRRRLIGLPGGTLRPASRETADRRTSDREMLDRLRTAVRALPNRYREVIVLRYLEELPIRQISEVLGIAPNAVEVRLTRARRRLAERLADLAEETS